MDDDQKPPERRPPWWVRVLLWGSSGRGAMLMYVWLSLALTAAFLVAGIWQRSMFVGTILIFSALGYWAAIRWMDRNDAWPDRKDK